MARKFGNRKRISKNINDFMIGIMGPSGWGKTTLMYETCEKLFGPDGYVIADMGDEDGTAAIDDIAAEQIPTWKKFKEMVDDIVKNKDTDYADLKIVILDTLDATFEKAEEFVVKSWNQENMGQQGFKPASSVNSVDGGFGKGLDRTIETVKKEINRLAKVGVKVWWTAHVKEKDQTDLFTGTNYTTLTANMSMKYFNSIKNISHIIGFGYFDRTVEKQEIGEANIVTKKKKTRNAVLGETRKIKFRDDSMIADAKSRFANIIDEITLNVDEFIKAIKDAINSSSEKNDTEMPVSTKPIPAVEEPDDNLVEEVEEPIENVEDIDEDAVPFDVDESEEEIEDEDPIIAINSEQLGAIRDAFKSSTAAVKAKVRKHLVAYNGKLSAEMHYSDVVAIEEILGLREE
ncbi:MAG: AAA family ATPase [Paludibacteraceae bacterium]|nr:AAA family ATPase [Paludibacteraceae bacterium]